MIIKNIFKLCLFIFFAATSGFCSKNTFTEKDEQPALIYLKNFLKEAYDAAKKSLQDPTSKSEFADIVIKNFSLTDMAPSILGPYRIKLSTQQQEEFEKKLTNYFLKTYGTTEKIKLFASTEMSDNQIRTKPQIINKNKAMVYNATFKTSQGEVSTKFTLLKKGENTFKVGDIQIAGIGLVVGTRDQIATLHKNQTVSPDSFLDQFEKYIQN
jgi:ABC-type transporter MlaC component